MISIRVSNIVRSFATEAEVSARVDGLPMVKNGDRLWFRFPINLRNEVYDGAEPFLAALLPIAMALGRPLSVEAPVSEQFLSGCRQIMSLYEAWDRRLHSIELRAATAFVRHESCHATGCFFTGGVDSFYSLLKNLERESGENQITHLLFIRGYANCPLESDQLFNRLSSNLEAVATASGLRLVLVSTNLKSFTPIPAAGWDWYAGAQLAAPAFCLAPMFRRVIVPAGDTYSTLSPWGSHPMVDPLWSTESLQFLHDGCEASRSRKLERYVAGSALAMENLRVCDYENRGLHNCGACEKCLRTLIGLRALRIDPPRGLFAQPIDLARVGQLDGGNRVIRHYLQDNLDLVRRCGGDWELEATLLRALRPDPLRWVSRQFLVRLQEFDRRLLNGRIRARALSEAAHSGEDAALRLAPIRWALSRWLGQARPMPGAGVRKERKRNPRL